MSFFMVFYYLIRVRPQKTSNTLVKLNEKKYGNS